MKWGVNILLPLLLSLPSISAVTTLESLIDFLTKNTKRSY